MAAADDPIHTLRRQKGKHNFAHLIKLDQGEACWDLIDAYGSCGDLFGHTFGLLTDEEVDKMPTEVVYSPVPQKDWAADEDCLCFVCLKPGTFVGEALGLADMLKEQGSPLAQLILQLAVTYLATHEDWALG